MTRSSARQPLVITTFFVILGGLALLSATSWYADKRLEDATGMVAHTLEVLSTLEHIKSNMAQAESAQRGYFLQAQPSFLRERERALDGVRYGILAIQQLTRDNPGQGARIAALRELFLAQGALFIATQPKQTPGQISGQDVYFANGALLWKQLEEHTDTIRATETALLASRIDEVTSSIHLFRSSFTLFMAVLFIALCMLMMQAYRDIGRKRRAGEALHDAENELALRQQAREVAEAADRSKAEFIANMSHEIRSPLNAILGLGFLLEQARLEPEARNMVRLMMASGRTLLASINDILDVSKIESGHMVIEHAPFRLADVIDRIAISMRLATADKSIDLIIDCQPDDVTTLIGDACRLEQVLLNLTCNAIKFTASGSIALRTEVVVRNDDHITLRFCVRDTGIGIAPELQESIFTAFTQADTSTTRRFGGTGLGLTICRQLVGLMGGKIGLISTPGDGSEFWFTLPLRLSDDPAMTTPMAFPDAAAIDALTSTLNLPPPGLPALDGVRLLIVDDSEINRDVAQRILSGEGALVTLADNGQAALDWLLAHPDDVDLVLMDVQMPIMDGIEATRQVRRLPQFDDLPIVALTAGAFKTRHDEAHAAGVNHFLSKPFDVPATIALVQRLRRARSDDTPVILPPAVPLASSTTMDVARGLQLWSDVRTYRDYLQRFASGHANVIAQIEAADNRSAAALAHKLSGDAANLGLPDLHRLAGLTERVLSEQQDATAVLAQLHTAMAQTLQEIAVFAPAMAAEAADPEALAGERTQVARIDLHALLAALLIALDSDNPTPVEPLLVALAALVPRAALAPLRECVHGFDFRGAEACVRLLALQHDLELKDR